MITMCGRAADGKNLLTNGGNPGSPAFSLDKTRESHQMFTSV
jgi:hypothetical protein